MSIKIHHGAPGSYKTSGAIADDFVPAVLAGRHIITNVRGLESEENVRTILENQGKNVPDGFRLTYLDTDNSETMEQIRRFWHWAPDHVFFLLDEIQEIYPRSYRDTHLNKLNYPGGIDAANAAGRFYNISLAFEKHRHRNWDFVVTSPNINKIHPIIRSSAESAYKHRNLATLGRFFSGRYVEGYHAADTNGKASDFYSIKQRVIPKYVFKFYKSTATGVFTDTISGQTIFKNPKIFFLIVFIIFVWVFVLSMGSPRIFNSVDNSPSVDSSSLPAGSAVSNNAVNKPAMAGVPIISLPPRLNFLNEVVYISISGSYEIGDQKKYWLRVVLPDKRYVILNDENVTKLGISVTVLDRCLYEIRAADLRLFAYCQDDFYDNIENKTNADSGDRGAGATSPLSAL